jgi:hypothetical protein
MATLKMLDPRALANLKDRPLAPGLDRHLLSTNHDRHHARLQQRPSRQGIEIS